MLVAATFFVSANCYSYDYIPQRIQVSPHVSIKLELRLKDVLQIITNRGNGAVSILTTLRELFSAENLLLYREDGKLESLRVTLMSYEFRSRELVELIEYLLKIGVNVRVITDSSRAVLLENPSASIKRRWSKNQRQYFIDAYDVDGDGKVSQDDIDKTNADRILSHWAWEELKGLQKRYSKNQLELIMSPVEIVPPNDRANYIHLHHFKGYWVESLQPNGTWQKVEAEIVSANATDSCTAARISNSAKNLPHYMHRGHYDSQGNFIPGDPYTLTKGSQGHVQFGAIIRDPRILEALLLPVDKWVDLYKRDKPFDVLPVPDKQNPRVVITDPVTGYVTTMQAYYSQGLDRKNKNYVDPILSMGEPLGLPENKLKALFIVNYVFTHKRAAMFWRHQLEKLSSKVSSEDFGIFVDAQFAVETYSALPQLLFADKVDNGLGVPSGKAIQQVVQLPENLHWQQNVMAYHGELGVFGGPADKLHSKLIYYEYEDRESKRHYVVAFGSANFSSNAGILNADGLIRVDSTDPSIAKTLREYIKALREDERMKPFSEDYLSRRFLEMFKATPTLFEGDFIQKFEKFLSQNSDVSQLKKLIKILKQNGVVELNSQGTNELNVQYGQNFLKIMQWLSEYGKSPFGWADLDLVLRLSAPQQLPELGFVEDLKTRWLGISPYSSTVRSFTQMIAGLFRTENAKTLKKPQRGRRISSRQMIIDHCEEHLRMLGISQPSTQLDEKPRGDR